MNVAELTAALVGKVTMAHEGERTSVLFQAAHTLAWKAYRREIGESDAKDACEKLHTAGVRNGLTDAEAEATIRSGWTTGIVDRQKALAAGPLPPAGRVPLGSRAKRADNPAPPVDPMTGRARLGFAAARAKRFNQHILVRAGAGTVHHALDIENRTTTLCGLGDMVDLSPATGDLPMCRRCAANLP